MLVVVSRWIDDWAKPVVELQPSGRATLGTLLGAIGPI